MRKWPTQVSTVVVNVGRELSLLKMAINMANAGYPSFFLWNELEPRCQQRAAGVPGVNLRPAAPMGTKYSAVQLWYGQKLKILTIDTDQYCEYKVIYPFFIALYEPLKWKCNFDKNFRHLLHQNLWFWQLLVQPAMKILPKWWHFRFSEQHAILSFVLMVHNHLAWD